jgi:hypothetical protein
MDVHQGPVNPYQHPGAHHFQHSQPLQQPPVPGFTSGFVPFQPQYFGPPQGLTTSYPATTAPSYNTAPPNNLRYQQQLNLPVHNAVPIRRPHPPPQLSQAPRPSPEIAQAEAPGTAQNVRLDKHLKGLRCIPEPPDKDLWRRRLFDVDGLMILTEEE